jgi:imidazolonepropionase-like amidohydrolase
MKARRKNAALIENISAVQAGWLLDVRTIQAATIHAAKVLNWSNDVGSIERGNL